MGQHRQTNVVAVLCRAKSWHCPNDGAIAKLLVEKGRPSAMSSSACYHVVGARLFQNLSSKRLYGSKVDDETAHLLFNSSYTQIASMCMSLDNFVWNIVVDMLASQIPLQHYVWFCGPIAWLDGA